MNNKILIIVAHPDDEILGCGGTIARLVEEKYEVYTLILGEGVTSRDEKREVEKRKGELYRLREEAVKANKIIGVKKIFFQEFPDNKFDTIAFLDIVKTIEKIKNTIKPKIIFTHYEDDLNIDHQITYKAVITATRPIVGENVKEIYSFEVLSSTEWNCSSSFLPNVFIDISKNIKDKIRALSIYRSELKNFLIQDLLKELD